MNRRHLILAAAAALVLACSGLPTAVPVPSGKEAYIGTWTGDSTTLSISREGNVAWEKTGGAGSTSINGPVQEWTDEGFTVGAFGITTTFTVDVPPKEVDGRWEMTVDGVALKKN